MFLELFKRLSERPFLRALGVVLAPEVEALLPPRLQLSSPILRPILLDLKPVNSRRPDSTTAYLTAEFRNIVVQTPDLLFEVVAVGC